MGANNNIGPGVFGSNSSWGVGVSGYSANGTGVQASNLGGNATMTSDSWGTGTAIVGTAHSGGYAAVFSGGNVGIGTTSPASQLQIGTGVSGVTGAAINASGTIYSTGGFTADAGAGSSNATLTLIGRSSGTGSTAMMWAA